MIDTKKVGDGKKSTDASKNPNRIPSNSLGSDEVVSAWQLPRMGNGGKIVKSAGREAGDKKKNPSVESIEDISSKVKAKPVTADELQKIVEQAQQEGYGEGFKEGMEKGLAQGEEKGRKLGEQKAYEETKAKLESDSGRLAAIAEQLFEPMQAQQESIENIVVEMALSLAKKIIASELKQSPDALYTIVSSALSALPQGSANIVVYLNSEDAALVADYIPAEDRDWQVKVDATLSHGSCKIETRDSLVEYRVEERLEEYMQRVADKGDVSADALPEVESWREEKNSDSTAAEDHTLASGESVEDDDETRLANASAAEKTSEADDVSTAEETDSPIDPIGTSQHDIEPRQ
ncbi:flagellar assembly protein FliH [Teredinibacter waterburyi]|uniref:flagellar assembly protein FliH n=1 Tax=Teredinibacter waterburyi TaxID=1500538 RepID=UPI00165FED65|nr:flagellar assembly protein FliH [Teredinibacter waterburyi]